MMVNREEFEEHRVEMLRKHRELWNKIAELIEDGKQCSYAMDYKKVARMMIYPDDENITVDCYCCEFDDTYGESDCKNCLVIWGSNAHNTCSLAEYGLFRDLIPNGLEEAAKVAREIANLPAREFAELPEIGEKEDEEFYEDE